MGRIAAIHRYPVKSMGGEAPRAVEVTSAGILGDRAYALVDAETGRVASAKRPRQWGQVLDWEASFADSPALGAPAPPVRIRLPDGSAAGSDEGPRLDARLSQALGRQVHIASEPPEGAAFEYHWPDMEGLIYQGRTYRDEVTVHRTPAGTFFDSTALLLITTASLARMRSLSPESDFDVRRFRPNFVIESAEDRGGFVEDAWVGHGVGIGPDARVEITKPCLRCVMVTLAQRGLPKDPEVLRAVFRHNDGNLGVKATVVRPGRVEVGDLVTITRSAGHPSDVASSGGSRGRGS